MTVLSTLIDSVTMYAHKIKNEDICLTSEIHEATQIYFLQVKDEDYFMIYIITKKNDKNFLHPSEGVKPSDKGYFIHNERGNGLMRFNKDSKATPENTSSGGRAYKIRCWSKKFVTDTTFKLYLHFFDKIYLGVRDGRLVSVTEDEACVWSLSPLPSSTSTAAAAATAEPVAPTELPPWYEEEVKATATIRVPTPIPPSVDEILLAGCVTDA